MSPHEHRQAADRPRFDERITYRVMVQGVVPDDWADRLGGLAIEATNDPATTLLTGQLTDQVELISVLNTLHDLRLSIISVEESDPDDNSRFPQEKHDG